MKYYSEDDVMDLIREAEDCERAYEWGEGHRRIHFEDYHTIKIPDKHGRLIDADCFLTETKDVRLERPTRNNGTEIIELGELFAEFINNAPTILEASKEIE